MGQADETEEVDEDDDETTGSGPAGAAGAGAGTSQGVRRIINLQQARSTAQDVFNFCLDNQELAPCNSLSEPARQIWEALHRLQITSHHRQSRLDVFFGKSHNELG